MNFLLLAVNACSCSFPFYPQIRFLSLLLCARVDYEILKSRFSSKKLYPNLLMLIYLHF